jgi:hypothetical protein
LVVGGSGIAGRVFSQELPNQRRAVHGPSRRAVGEIAEVKPISADLFDPAGLNSALAGYAPSHVYIST